MLQCTALKALDKDTAVGMYRGVLIIKGRHTIEMLVVRPAKVDLVSLLFTTTLNTALDYKMLGKGNITMSRRVRR